MPAIGRAGFQLVLHPSGAVYLPECKTWLVADAHFGKAVSFRLLGVPVPRGTTTGTLERLSALLDARPTDRIVFLGDFLHSARSHAESTQSSLAAWRSAHPGLHLTLVRGNHDDRAGDPPAALGIEVVDEPLMFESQSGQASNRLALCHHPQAIEGAYVLAGHWHPCVTVRGRANDRLRLPCFWFAEEDPAESEPSGSGSGSAVLRRQGAAPDRKRAAVGILPAFGVFTGMHPIERRSGDLVFAIAGALVRQLPEF
ncbi:MAG: ligase-associated DNA damage response endonuclease PdeM [Comamonadaceae bacterium]|nr:MAG: ligase-associated DNA damage response endonuclease PdeM [Comamonadaceae bacterium]